MSQPEHHQDQLDLEQIVAFLRNVEVINKFDEVTLHEIAAIVQIIHVPRGEVLFRQNDIAEKFYIVVKGTLQATTHDDNNEEIVIGEIGAHEFIGEIGLLIEKHHTATVRTIEDSDLLQLSNYEYRNLMKKYPDTVMDITNLSTKRITAFLSNIEVFSKYDEEILRYIAGIAKIVYIASGNVLLHQNQISDSFYIVMHGRLRATTYKDKNTEAVLGEIGQGEFVGEIGLLIDALRTANILAIRDSVLLRFDKADFDKLLQKYPHAVMDIAKFSIKRLTKKTLPKNTIITIALLPAGDNPLLSDFSQKFVAELENFGSTLHLSSATFKAIYGSFVGEYAESFENERIISWLNQQEAKYRYIVYQADTTLTDWTQRCVRQADRILLVGLHNCRPELNEIEAQLFKGGYEKYKLLTEFVLSHETPSARPFDTAKWLNLRPIINHHQVLMPSKSHFAKLARFLTGRAQGLVLSGGGARAIAHIGLIRALRELNIEIDIVGGTSMGGWVAGLFAIDVDYQTMLENIAVAVKIYQRSFRYTLPLVSLFNDHVVTEAIKASYGNDVYIEDLWRRCFCVSTNLTRGSLVVHDRGLLWKAVRASTSLPVIFPPISNEKNELLVDGGVINNLPVDIMREYINDGIIIASVATQPRENTEYQVRELNSGWQLLFQQLNPFGEKKKFPNIGHIVLSATLLSSKAHSSMMSKEANYCINLDSSKFGLLDFKSFEQIIEVGYQIGLEEFSKDIYRDVKNIPK